MSGDLSVHHPSLADGAAGLSGLTGRASALAGRVEQALSGLAEAAGHPGLAGAFTEVNVLNARRLAELRVLYDHVGESLKTAAKRYDATDARSADRINGAQR